MPFVLKGIRQHRNLIVNARAMRMGVFWMLALILGKGRDYFPESLRDSLVSCAHGRRIVQRMLTPQILLPVNM